MPSGQALLEQQEGMHHKQLQLFLNGRSLCPAATLPRQPYTHPGSCLFPLGLQRFKEYITSVLSLRHCHFVFIKSSPAASEGESRKKISASLKKKIGKKRKQMAPSQAKPSALLITSRSKSVPFPPSPPQPGVNSLSQALWINSPQERCDLWCTGLLRFYFLKRVSSSASKRQQAPSMRLRARRVNTVIKTPATSCLEKQYKGSL